MPRGYCDPSIPACFDIRVGSADRGGTLTPRGVRATETPYTCTTIGVDVVRCCPRFQTAASYPCRIPEGYSVAVPPSIGLPSLNPPTGLSPTHSRLKRAGIHLDRNGHVPARAAQWQFHGEGSRYVPAQPTGQKNV